MDTFGDELIFQPATQLYDVNFVRNFFSVSLPLDENFHEITRWLIHLRRCRFVFNYFGGVQINFER